MILTENKQLNSRTAKARTSNLGYIHSSPILSPYLHFLNITLYLLNHFQNEYIASLQREIFNKFSFPGYKKSMTDLQKLIISM